MKSNFYVHYSSLECVNHSIQYILIIEPNIYYFHGIASWEKKKKRKNITKGLTLLVWKLPGHPNVRLFITHGGLLGAQEAVYCGVPILGIPLFGDQHLNMAYFVKKGLALKLDYRQLSYAPVSNALNELLVNKR